MTKARFIFPHYSYEEALGKAGLVTLYEPRENTVVKRFEECNDPNHHLYQWLPPFNLCKINFRSKRTFSGQKLNIDSVRNSLMFKKAIENNF